MPRLRWSLPSTLLVLTVTTGLVDAVSVLGLGHVFTANMTGNVVFLAFAAAGADGFSFSASLLALGAFLVGAVGGGWWAKTAGRPPGRDWLLQASAIEVLLLGAAALCAIDLPLDASFGRRSAVIALTALAMGSRNAVVRRLGLPDLTTTVLTLTLTGLAADSTLAGGDNPRAGRRIGSLLAMFSGAVVGAVLVLHAGIVWALTIAFAVSLLATIGFHAVADDRPAEGHPAAADQEAES